MALIVSVDPNGPAVYTTRQLFDGPGPESRHEGELNAPPPVVARPTAPVGGVTPFEPISVTVALHTDLPPIMRFEGKQTTFVEVGLGGAVGVWRPSTLLK